ncbi:MAG: hypothetical protein PHF31_04000 [Methylobacter sp.]|nr:hypothetical protein [Methylobacter sp.]
MNVEFTQSIGVEILMFRMFRLASNAIDAVRELTASYGTKR